MNMEQLQAFLEKADIPIIKAKPKTFLGIAKQPHYENVLSNIYAFFFKKSEEHGFTDLFIKSFLNLVKNKKSDKCFSFEYFGIHTEFPTDDGGRIDLLLKNDSEAIIIENKVYHILNNKLHDYWDTIRVKNKIGVVLSLRKIPYTGNENFINITHLELMEEVMRNLNIYKEQASPKYLIFLEDLHQNIKNLSLSHMKVEELELFLLNKDKINQLVKYRRNIQVHVEDEIAKACKELGGNLKLAKPKDKNRGKRLRYMISPSHKDLVITVVYGELLNEVGGQLHLIVEMRNKLLNDREQYRNIQFPAITDDVRRDDFFEIKDQNYEHFASKSYDLGLENFHDLNLFIVRKLKEDGLYSVYTHLNSYIKESRKEKQKRNPQPVEQ
ncbi:PD-(D/E)XK nuclease family protein [Marinifilum sp. D714]|uniref:PD-(D/E)XK nuclease family protein n=1 Tax=Marinifilum sp. D714 TaxID=2937523 RepID=UPI0027CE5D65|nr:PD-(D/E)XK nuclease family protein [Marinifilum sp. D714]MDQ2178788.1 PD-(D/E)XK nuclease family protein [Marinifilum sp. D714]